MNIKELRELLELIEQTAIDEFEMERAGVRIRIRKNNSGTITTARPSDPVEPSTGEAEKPAPGSPPPSKTHLFRAPIVGTFYGSPKPDAEAFVRPGDNVQKGSVLCIIEAMKLFNQIESDVDGEIVRTLVENGQPVEYGEPLFEIRLKNS